MGVVRGLLGLNLKLQPTPDAGYERNRKGNQTALDHLQNVCVSVCDVYCACWSTPFFGDFRRPPESLECLMQRQMFLKHHFLDDGTKNT